jgi:hypothetical protein
MTDEIIRMAREVGLRSAVLLHMWGKEDALCDSEIEELRRIEAFADLVAAAERSRHHDEIERLTNLCYEYLGELTALRATKQMQDAMRDGLTIGSAWVRDGKRLEPTSVYKSMEDDT